MKTMTSKMDRISPFPAKEKSRPSAADCVFTNEFTNEIVSSGTKCSTPKKPFTDALFGPQTRIIKGFPGFLVGTPVTRDGPVESPPSTTRNHVSTLEVQTAEKPVTMRVCGQVQIVNWGLFYPVVLPNFHGLNFAGKWL